MALNKSFRRGQSTFTCRCCKRLTRDTGGEGGVELCAQCYELAGLENELNDYGVSADLIQSATAYFEELLKKNITADVLENAFADLYALCFGDEPDALVITPAGDIIRESEYDAKREAVLKGKRDRQKARRAARKA